MTSRGNQSVSPPAQTPQQRHVNTISSSTPPPQQFYSGPSSALHQTTCEFLPHGQGQPFLTYQAYGSAVNDTRAQAANSGRGGPPQQSLSQGGGFYQQPGPNMRPQQAQQGHTAPQQCFLTTQAPSSMRHPRLQHPSSLQPMVFIPQAVPSSNSVITIPANVYPSPGTVSLFSPTYPTTFQPNMVYYQNGPWQRPGMATAQAALRPRERKVLSIMDPDTGRNITEEIFSGRPQSTDTEEHPDEVTPGNENNKEICQIFTRLVAETLKTPDDANTSGAPAEPLTGAPAISSATLPSSQYQQPPPQQQQQPPSLTPAAMIRPPLSGPPPALPPHIIRPGMIQQPATPPTPPHDIQHQMPNLSMPPPQFSVRQQTPTMFGNAQQQHPSGHHNPRHPLPQQQPSVRPPMPAAVPAPSQQTQGPQHQAAHSGPSPTVIDSTTHAQKVEPNVPEKQPQVEPTSPDNIPVKPAGHPASATEPAVKPSSPVKEQSPAPHILEEVKETKKQAPPSTVKTKEETHMVDKIEEIVKEEVTQGGSSQGVKDGRKGKKGRKDLNRKEIGGSEMDAFIDKNDGAISGAGESIVNAHGAPPVTSQTTASAVPIGQGMRGHIGTGDPEAKQQTVASKNSEISDKKMSLKDAPASELNDTVLENGLLKDEEKLYSEKSQEQVKQAAASVQNEAPEVDGKLPISQPVRDHKISQDKPLPQDSKPVQTSIPATQEQPEVSNKVPPPQTVVYANTVPTHSAGQESKAPTSSVDDDTKTIPEATPKTDKISNVLKNQNEQPAELSGSNVQSNRHVPEQTENQASKKLLDNGVTDTVRAEPKAAVTIEVTDDSSRISHRVFNDENEPPRDSFPKQKEDIKKMQEVNKKVQPTPTDSEGAPKKSSLEQSVNKIKKDGKLQYDRAYLIELRECATAQTKPEGLPDLDIILDRPIVNANRGSSTAPLDFTPAFFQQGGNQRHAPQIGKTNSRNRPRSDVQITPRIIKSVSLQDSVKPLHQSEKPWKPSQKQLSAGELAEKKKTLEAEVLFIMNRLTPTNFERLAAEMKKLDIKTYEDLQELVNIFFDKVTMETKFVEAYALLCKFMSGLKVPPNSGMKENQATFRVVMLTKCQQEFEADKSIIFEDPEEKRKKIEAEMPDTPERATQIENTLYHMKLRRLKFYGNIRFIGELFKLGMLTETIMHDCIYRLLKARDDDSLVSLCNLITTVGHVLDTEKAKTRMDQYFAQMAKIAEERKSRIKFTLKDVIDLRNNNWVPRKEQTGPKKIDEVHKDFQEEQATKQFLQSQPLPPRIDTPQLNNRHGSRQRQDDKPADDGWNTVSSKSLRIDASKMKLSKNIVDENSIQLGPGGGLKMWSRGSYGGALPSQELDRNAPPANRFSALRGEEDRRNYQKSPSRDGNVANRGMRQGSMGGYGRGKMLARSSQEGDRRDALASARSIVGGRSQNSSRDNSWNREDRRQTMGPRGSREGDNPMTRSDITLRPSSDSLMPPPKISPARSATTSGYNDVVKKLKPLSQNEMEHKAKTILEEYLNARDLEEAKLCLMELQGQENLHVLVTTCINEVLERSSKERDLAGLFFHEMIKRGQLSMDVYIKGLAEVLQYAEDMVIDVPMMYAYLAQMIVPLLTGGTMSWTTLPTVLQPYLEGQCSARLLAEILLLAKDRTSEEEVALMWQSNNLEWTTFLPADKVSEFLKDKKLEFTVSPVSITPACRVSGYNQVDYQKITADIESLVHTNASSNEIWAYIEAQNIDKQDRYFIRALMTALASASISPSMKFNEDTIKNHKDLLVRCIKRNSELELQALYAIQALMLKLEHPSGVIANIFNMLYDEEVISEEAFKQWEKSADPQEKEGKGACSMQLTQFFAWLRENEEPETS